MREREEERVLVFFFATFFFLLRKVGKRSYNSARKPKLCARKLVVLNVIYSVDSRRGG